LMPFINEKREPSPVKAGGGFFMAVNVDRRGQLPRYPGSPSARRTLMLYITPL
jgi:hypothetical protein